MDTAGLSRCPWPKSALDIAYHDTEWGVPCHDDRKLFEFVILEGAQAGLSWATILKRREGYRAAFDGFDVEKVAAYDDAKKAELMRDERIIRNRLKIESAVKNARVFIAIQKEFGSFDAYIWSFVGGKPITNEFSSPSEVPATTPVSDAIAKDLKKRGMSFMGSTIVYAHMQATGMANDHLTGCHRHAECSRIR